MKKISPFMLVRHVSLLDSDSAPIKSIVGTDRRKPAKSKPPLSSEAQAQSTVSTILSSSPLLSKTFESLNPALTQTLASPYRGVGVSKADTKKTATKKAARKAEGASKKKVSAGSSTSEQWVTAAIRKKGAATGSRKNVASAGYVEQITHDLSRADNPLRVGILDLGAWIAGLPDLLVRLNGAQSIVTLFEINAPVPAGLRKTAKGMVEWFARHQVKQSRKQVSDLEPHIVFEEFFHAASDIRAYMGLDMVVGLTPVMVAGESDGSLYWNHFSNVQDGVILISTMDVREFAQNANRPFEAAVGGMLIGAVLVGLNDQLGYHDQTLGCLFDYNEDRSGIVAAIKMARICPECSEVLTEKQQSAAESMLKVLRKMKRKRS
ncbi:hypothetical protein HBF26_12090 [Luteibacter jiangsuensis]|uniref:Nucleic acid/nucleotide deaminase of polymorphic system toxin n=1 Tax=Luteibacter jiangsuensis TaxID=637577 RepID=A0ABX0Q764_9GAMM|nr:hypothetical protein [Luteibacter jiangsuensis]NID05631.1 hypothetical protein [Luteibacter jiangsuensis]